jgi:hypothetical protein
MALGALLCGVLLGGLALTTRDPRPAGPVVRLPEMPTLPPTGPRGAPNIDARATDPKPMTLARTFPERTVVSFGHRYRILRTDLATDCGATAAGRGPAVLRGADCTQVLRATAVDAAGRSVVTVGIANLRDAAAAKRVDAAMDNSPTAAFRPMRVPGTPAATFRPAVHRTVASGHYVVFAVGGAADGSGRADIVLRRAVHDLTFVVVDHVLARLFGGD